KFPFEAKPPIFPTRQPINAAGAEYWMPLADRFTEDKDKDKNFRIEWYSITGNHRLVGDQRPIALFESLARILLATGGCGTEPPETFYYWLVNSPAVRLHGALQIIDSPFSAAHDYCVGLEAQRLARIEA